MMELPNYVAARPTGQCLTGRQGDAGRLVHLALDIQNSEWSAAACGYKPGRLSSGWHYVSGARITCPRCKRKAERWLSERALDIVRAAWRAVDADTEFTEAEALNLLRETLRGSEALRPRGEGE